MTDPPRRADDPLPTEENPIPFGRYQLVELVGEGAMAQVYRARQSGPMGFSKEVALKRLRKGAMTRDRREIQALVNEARLGGRLRHPNVVEIYGCDVHDGTFFLAMEYVRGWLLDDVLWRVLESGQELPRGAVIDVLRQIASGLAYAHEATDENGQPLRLVHRDLKPQNVFLDRMGVIKIADFGLAKSTSNLYKTTDGDETKGSPLYMSPEQIGGDSLDGRSDLFALGTVMVELVTGLRPFEGNSIPNTLMRVLHVDCGEAMDAFSQAGPDLLPVVGRLLRQRPEDRYPSARALLHDLDAIAGDAIMGAHTRALVGALLGEDTPGLPESLKAPYADLGLALAAAGTRACDPSAHMRKAPGDAWRRHEKPPPRKAADLRLPGPEPRSMQAPAPLQPAPEAEAHSTQPVPPTTALPEVVVAPPRRRRPRGPRLVAVLATVAALLALLLGWLLYEGWGEIREAGARRAAAPDGESVAGSAADPRASRPPARPETSGSPAIHVPRASVRVWQDLPVAVQLLEEGTWRARVHYRGSASSTWRTVDLEERGGGRLEVSIPITEEYGPGLDYWIELAREGSGDWLPMGSTEATYHVSVL